MIAHPLLMLLTIAAVPSTKSTLRTIAEESGFKKTGRYDEVIRLCEQAEKIYPGRARCTEFGRTPEGRPMMVLSASEDGALDPATAQKRSRPVILFQGGIHAGEIDGKDAGFWLLRELLEGRALPGALSHVTAVFVPVFNVDGHERFGAHNRPNQRGPEEMGWRTTAQNLNLNRDYAKAEAPEMIAMLNLLGAWDPILYIDLHVTDGADFEHDVSVLIDPAEVGPEPLGSLAKTTRDDVLSLLKKRGHLPLGFYPSFERDDDPRSGFALGSAPPRFSSPYWSLHNRMGMLVETHSWKPYSVRVRATYDTLLAVFELAGQRAADWVKIAAAADANAKTLGGTEIPLAFDHTAHTHVIDFRGYAYQRTASAISGRMRTSYDPKRPEIWKVPLFDELKAVSIARAPLGGYVVPPAQAAFFAAKLDAHHVEYRRVEKERPPIDVEVFLAQQVEFAKAPYEGRQRVTMKAGAWTKDKRAILAGSLFVPIAQRPSRLVVHLFEPTAPDSFLAWGFMNTIFEKKEYMESYLAEQIADEMLKHDRALLDAFTAKLDTDKEFARDPEQRLEFFYRRHPSYDRELNAYPILRVDREL